MLQSIKYNGWDITPTLVQKPRGVIVPNQVHESTIVSASNYTYPIKADGLVSTIKENIPFGVRTADCMPLVLITPTRSFAIHISRHTLAHGILGSMLSLLQNEVIEFAYIGPHICETCLTFTYKGDTLELFEQKYPEALTEKVHIFHLSLLQVITRFLRLQKVPEKNIFRDTRCTFESPELYSYRRWIAEANRLPFPEMTTVVSRS